MRAADSTRTDGSARISHGEFAIDKQRIVGDLRRWDARQAGAIVRPGWGFFGPEGVHQEANVC
jgi:hypothetical protein